MQSDRFGESLPFCEPYWYQGYPSPYYTQGHKDFRAKVETRSHFLCLSLSFRSMCFGSLRVEQVRRFVEEELKPNVDAWIKCGYPMQLHERAYELGIQGIIYPPAYGGTPPPDFDAFYELIMVDEMSRVGGGRSIAL
jgi:hypothetical protein